MQKEENIRIIITGDGSHSLELPGMDETYHSRHGAFTESQYVFIEMGILNYLKQYSNPEELNILEVGFGTGLNVLLTSIKSKELKKEIKFTSLEPFPLSKDIYQNLNYGKLAGEESLYNSIHQSDWGSFIPINLLFSLKKMNSSLENVDLPNNQFDIIFFDAFAPSKQADVWSLQNLEKCYRVLKSPGQLITYCAQGNFRRNLMAAGFEVEKLPGPPGKFEMIRGTKKGKIE